jgi:hypothetical protein
VAFSNIDFVARAYWYSQHRYSLIRAEACQHNDLPVRKFKRVVMAVPQTWVDLAETGYLVTERARKDKPGFAPYVVLEGKLGARKQTNSNVRLIYRGKPTRDRVGKTRGY